MKTKLHNHVSQCVRKIENEDNDVLTLTPAKPHFDFIQIHGELFAGPDDKVITTNIGGEIFTYMSCGSCNVDQKSVYEKYGYEFDKDSHCSYWKSYAWDERSKIADEVEAIVIAIGGEKYANTYMGHEERIKAEEEQKKKEQEELKKLKKKQLKQSIWLSIAMLISIFLLSWLLSAW